MKAVVHIMGHLAKDHRVLFVAYAFTFKDLIMAIFGRGHAPLSRILGFKSRLQSITYKGNTLYQLTLPPVLPLQWITNTKLFV